MTRRFNHKSSLLARLAVVSVTVLVGMAFASASSAQASTCSFSSGVLNLNLSDTGNGTTIETAGGTIAITSGGPVTCAGGTPTTRNTDVVRVLDVSDNVSTPAPGDGSTRLVVLEPETFGSGITPEPAPSKGEVEFVVNMGAGSADALVVVKGPLGPADWTAGAFGFNWNGDDDPDLMGGPFDEVTLSGGLNKDRISAHGGAGTGAPLVATKISIEGEAGDDELLGSDGRDFVDGGPGNDSVAGLEGDDVLVGQSGDDSFEGGPGVDTVDWSLASAGVTVDLGLTGPQSTGAGVSSFVGIERLRGTQFDDTLIGDGSANLLNGNNGNDSLDGRGGSDELVGYGGSDTVTFAAAPGAVSADLAAGSAAQGADADKLTDIDNLVGSPFADTLAGDAAANRIVGGGGADAIDARGGADLVELRDGLGDQASCGDGADSAIADRLGIDLLAADCETLDLLPEPAQQPDGGPGEPATVDSELSFVLAGSRWQRVLRQRAVRVRVRSPLEASTTTVSASGKLPRLRVGPVTAAVAAGSTRTLALRLTRKQLAAIRRALAAGRAPTLTVKAVARDAAGNRVVRTLRVKLKR